MIDTNIRSNIASFYDPLDMPGGWSFDHVDRMKMNTLLYLGKFKTGQYDEQGYRKFSFNKVRPTCDIATKFIDLDVKNVITSAKRQGDELTVFFLQRRLQQYLLENDFGELLNELGIEFPKGHIVVKWANKKHHLVNKENLRLDTSVKWMKDSTFVYEIHRMTRGELENAEWESSELLERHPDEQEFVIYECYEKRGKKWNREIRGDVYTTVTDAGMKSGTETMVDKRDNYVASILLDEDEDVDFPYREVKWDDVTGRWLGQGFPELLEDNQIATNEAENLERKGLMFTSLKLYQTRDDSIGGSNVLTDAQNGDILQVDQEIQPIAMEERNLAAYNATRQRWDQNTEEKTFSYDITRGENLPSRTPVGVANLSASMATSYFELKRQKLGMFVKKLILDDIIPSFEKDTAAEHVLMFAGSDEEIDRLDDLIADSLVDETALMEAEKTGFLPSKAVRDKTKELVTKQLKKKVNRYLKVMKDAYKNVEYILDVNVVGEAFDLNKHNEGLNFAMEVLNNNPAVLDNPVAKAIFFDLLGKNGFSPAKLSMLNQKAEQGMAQGVGQGGSLSRSQPAAAGVGAKEQII